MWIAKSENVQNGQRIQIYQGEDPISFGAYLKLLEQDQRFASWFTDLLAGADYEAFFWEHPPLCDANIDSEVEFVLLDSPALATLSPDPQPFSSHFERDRESEIVSQPGWRCRSACSPAVRVARGLCTSGGFRASGFTVADRKSLA